MKNIKTIVLFSIPLNKNLSTGTTGSHCNSTVKPVLSISDYYGNPNRHSNQSQATRCKQNIVTPVAHKPPRQPASTWRKTAAWPQCILPPAFERTVNDLPHRFHNLCHKIIVTFSCPVDDCIAGIFLRQIAWLV